jgi:hypothetical protein
VIPLPDLPGRLDLPGLPDLQVFQDLRGQQPVCGLYTSWRPNSDGSYLRKAMNNRGYS